MDKDKIQDIADELADSMYGKEIKHLKTVVIPVTIILNLNDPIC